MHLLGNANFSERAGQIALCLAGNVLSGHAVLDEELAAVSVSGADRGCHKATCKSVRRAGDEGRQADDLPHCPTVWQSSATTPEEAAIEWGLT